MNKAPEWWRSFEGILLFDSVIIDSLERMGPHTRLCNLNLPLICRSVRLRPLFPTSRHLNSLLCLLQTILHNHKGILPPTKSFWLDFLPDSPLLCSIITINDYDVITQLYFITGQYQSYFIYSWPFICQNVFSRTIPSLQTTRSKHKFRQNSYQLQYHY
jgi:hypothetical protein